MCHENRRKVDAHGKMIRMQVKKERLGCNMDKESKFELEQERDSLVKLVPKLEKEIAKAPEGSLVTLKARGRYPQYYHYIEGDREKGKNGRYLSKKEIKLVQRLAQKQYEIEVLECAKKRVNAISVFLKHYQENDTETIFDKLPEEKKILITPWFETEETFVNKWKEKMRGNANGFPKEIEFYTESGECVRSKSEKILADGFYHRGIPYVYEPELELADGSRIYPDFALLHKGKRKTIYFEHFGLMDYPEYSAKAIKKIMRFEENGYWFGDNFLCTFETSENPLDMRIVEKMLKHYF